MAERCAGSWKSWICCCVVVMLVAVAVVGGDNVWVVGGGCKPSKVEVRGLEKSTIDVPPLQGCAASGHVQLASHIDLSARQAWQAGRAGLGWNGTSLQWGMTKFSGWQNCRQGCHQPGLPAEKALSNLLLLLEAVPATSRAIARASSRTAYTAATDRPSVQTDRVIYSYKPCSFVILPKCVRWP